MPIWINEWVTKLSSTTSVWWCSQYKSSLLGSDLFKFAIAYFEFWQPQLPTHLHANTVDNSTNLGIQGTSEPFPSLQAGNPQVALCQGPGLLTADYALHVLGPLSLCDAGKCHLQNHSSPIFKDWVAYISSDLRIPLEHFSSDSKSPSWLANKPFKSTIYCFSWSYGMAELSWVVLSWGFHKIIVRCQLGLHFSWLCACSRYLTQTADSWCGSCARSSGGAPACGFSIWCGFLHLVPGGNALRCSHEKQLLVT